MTGALLVRTAEGRPTSDPLDLLDLLEGSDEVIIVDAMHSGLPPGTIRRFDLGQEPLPSRSFVSSHLLSVGEAVELARTLGRSLQTMVVYGIEVRNLELGRGLSAEVRDAVRALVDEIDISERVP